MQPPPELIRRATDTHVDQHGFLAADVLLKVLGRSSWSMHTNHC